MRRVPTIYADDDSVEFFNSGSEILCSVYRGTMLTGYSGLPTDARQEIEDHLAALNFTRKSNHYNFERWKRAPAPDSSEVKND